jgi:hypothetical protein
MRTAGFALVIGIFLGGVCTSADPEYTVVTIPLVGPNDEPPVEGPEFKQEAKINAKERFILRGTFTCPKEDAPHWPRPLVKVVRRSASGKRTIAQSGSCTWKRLEDGKLHAEFTIKAPSTGEYLVEVCDSARVLARGTLTVGVR